MSNNEIIFGQKKKTRERVCRVSYVLNNSQPVRSTIIGDQPLFYMDFDCGVEEDEGMFFDPNEIGLLENEIESLRKQISSMDRLADQYAPDPEKDRKEFEDTMHTMGVTFVKTSVSHGIDEVKAALSNSRLAKAYLELAETHNIKIMHSQQVQDASYERRSGFILVNPSLDMAEQILLATRELRRHWQHRQGALINPLLFHPDNAVLVNRLQTADLLVSMVRVAWELQLRGEKNAWERIENSPMSDLGRAFAREAFADFRTINNGQAGAAVLETWFLSERCRHEDKKLIKQMLADYQGYVFEEEEARKTIAPSLIFALGTMPYGKNYLAAHSTTIINDAVFTEVRDRSNANFLWFIKFERSFRETEQELQNKSSQSTKDVRPGQSQVKNYENESAPATAEIIRIYPDNTGSGDNKSKDGKILPPKSSVKRNKKKTTAEIVYLRRWSGE